MRIDILCSDGSPIGVSCKTINGDDHQIGVGGAELALLTMCKLWREAGHEVTLYNSPRPGWSSPFAQRNINEFDPSQDRDVMIMFRSPNRKVSGAKGKKIWWSCDQYTVGNFADFSKLVDKIVTISPFHQKYFEERYGIIDTTYIDVPVRTWEYHADIVKIPGQCLFSSVPDRGLHVLFHIWPKIKAAVPEATLVITSDYRLWGCEEARNDQHRLGWLDREGVKFLGAVKRSELIKIQLQSQLLLYPCVYDELFCISAAEAQVAGAYPITSMAGALPTTNMGTKIEGNTTDPLFIDKFARVAIDLLKDPEELADCQRRISYTASMRFSPARILDEWDKVFNE